MCINFRGLLSAVTKMSKYRVCIAAVVAFAAILSGCRSSQQAAKPVESESRIAASSLSQRLGEVAASMRGWQSVKMPMSVKIESPAKASLGGTVVMQRGRGISMSLRFMGLVEVGTLTVTDDSITVIDKYHKLYLAEPVSGLLGGVGFTVNNLQDILLGRAFVAGSDGFTPSDDLALHSLDGDVWSVTPPPFDSRWSYSFVFDAYNLIKELVVSASGLPKAVIQYDGLDAATPAGPVAGKMTVDVPGRRAVKVSVTWKTGRAQWDSAQVEMPSVPAGYRRIMPDMLPSLFGDL